MKKLLISSILVAFFMQIFTTVSLAQTADFKIVDKNPRCQGSACQSCPIPGTYQDVNITLDFYADPNIALNDWTHLWQYSLVSSSAHPNPCPDDIGETSTGNIPHLFMGWIRVDCHYDLTMTHVMCRVDDPNYCLSATSVFQAYNRPGKVTDKNNLIDVYHSKVEYKNNLATSAAVTLSDINGRVLLQKEVAPYETEIFDTNNLSSGIYLLSSYQDGKISTKKISKID
jgi:Secretion system C-terminal sorting domain